MRFDAEGQRSNEGTAMDPYTMDREFAKAVAEADPEMGKDALKMRTMVGVFKTFLKGARGEPLSVTERAQVQLFHTVLAALKRMRPGVGVFMGTMMGLFNGEMMQMSMPLKVDGCVMGTACFVCKIGSAAAQDTARLEQAAATVAAACVRAAPGGDEPNLA